MSAPAECVGFADCPCARCRDTRRTVTAGHPAHDGEHPNTAANYCGACLTAERDKAHARYMRKHGTSS
jgi:hypothetical protein